MKRGSASNRLLDRYLGIMVLRLISLFNRRRPIPSAFETIGILASPTIGDTLLTSGAVSDLRCAFPDARIICFATQGPAKAAADLIPGIDEIRIIDFMKPGPTIRTMRNCQLDLIVDFTQWQRITAFYSGLSGARYRLGFRSKGQHRHFLYDASVLHSAEVHETENFRTLVRALGVATAFQPKLNVRPREALSATSVIVFHPWATGDRGRLREWDTQNWVAIAKELAHQDTSFVVTSSPSELARSEKLVRRLRREGLSAKTFCGRDGLFDLSYQLQQCELAISVNTGIMHLAALLGTPTISLNGPTATHRWGPVGPDCRSVEPQGGGGGYLHFGFEFRGKPQDTMQRIRVEDVFSAAQELMPRLRKAYVAQV